jgi:hypothetical protein
MTFREDFPKRKKPERRVNNLFDLFSPGSNNRFFKMLFVEGEQPAPISITPLY